VVFVGNSLALVAGLPLGTFLGQLTGWRVAFLLTGAFATATMLTLRRVLPALAGADSTGFSTNLLRRLARPQLLAIYAITISLVVGHFAAYSYLAPIVSEHGGITGSGYSALLLVYGAVGLVATVGLGRLVDSHPRRSFAVPMATIAVATAVLVLAGHSTVLTVITVLAWGGAFTAIPVMLQAAVLRRAEDPDVASAVYVVAFQIGIGGGAALGGVLVDGGHLDASIGITTVGATLGLLIGVGVRELFPRR
jgi:predicted MFS family arabinose efflux permease